jgi:hypothetical protein
MHCEPAADLKWRGVRLSMFRSTFSSHPAARKRVPHGSRNELAKPA